MKEFGSRRVEFEVLMCGRSLCEISCSHFPWRLKDENPRKFRQNFAAFFVSLFRLTGQKNSPELRSGELQA